MVNGEKTKRSSHHLPFTIYYSLGGGGLAAADLVDGLHHRRANFGRERAAHGEPSEGRQDFFLAGEREQHDDGEAHFAVRVALDGADERLNFAGLRHQEEQRECLVGLLTALARELDRKSNRL